MAKTPTKSSALRTFNIIETLRGNFDFKNKAEPTVGPIAYKGADLISPENRTRLLSGAYNVISSGEVKRSATASLQNLTQRTASHVGSVRVENRKILTLMPEVAKAARLMIASTISPNDLSRHNIDITFACEGLQENSKLELEKKATEFFQKKLNLKTAIFEWIWQFGYETGSTVLTVVPMKSFAKKYDESFVGTESFVKTVVDEFAHESLFGFGDSRDFKQAFNADVTALESFTTLAIGDLNLTKDDEKSLLAGDKLKPGVAKSLVAAMIGHEALNLTDNPTILQANDISDKRRKKKTGDALRSHFKMPKAEPILSIDSDIDDGEVMGDPILMKIPSESVTVIHTPGDPSDHQGYFILLDHTGTPIDVTSMEGVGVPGQASYDAIQNNIINQSFAAYGLDRSYKGINDKETMARIYAQVVQHHLLTRLDKAGFNRVETSNMDSALRCMFGRFLQQKQTRILFMPKDLVEYMAFELDQHGVGVSRLENIKFNLGLKMAVQVSRVLASIKSAMDNREINVKFTENLMENPEQVLDLITQNFHKKNLMSFTTDPNSIQSQIIDKSVSIKASDIPGLEGFEITNVPDTRTNAVDFDPSILEYIDKMITNGLRIPAATMNSLGEDEYARSVVTTNLFFAADVSIDQDIVIKQVSGFLRKWARYSESFRAEIYKILPELEPGSKKSSKSSTDDTDGVVEKREEVHLPKGFTIETLIDSLTISLPKPNVAPSKAQFEALEAMATAISSIVTAMVPDDLAGTDETLKPVIAVLRAAATAENIRDYLESSGMSSLKVPDSDFTDQLDKMSNLQNALQNVRNMLNDRAKIGAPQDPPDPTGTQVPGY